MTREERRGLLFKHIAVAQDDCAKALDDACVNGTEAAIDRLERCRIRMEALHRLLVQSDFSDA